jgi:hypothetical protein
MVVERIGSLPWTFGWQKMETFWQTRIGPYRTDNVPDAGADVENKPRPLGW